MLKQGLLLVCCLLLIASCAGKKTEITKVQKRTPASQRPYTVFGERYEPLSSHEGFVQTGIASWYGKDFHGKTTSNGERYDMHGMTAAHKTLPLGVYVKVRNRDNGREVVLRVNDRGPFVKGRIIDVSYAAAMKLGIDVSGTAPAKVEALGYREDGKGTYTKPESYDNGNFTVQIGAFKEYANAERLSGEMKKLFGFSEMHLTNVNGEMFYRVYAGKYKSLNAAQAAEKNFTEHGYPRCFTVALD